MYVGTSLKTSPPERLHYTTLHEKWHMSWPINTMSCRVQVEKVYNGLLNLGHASWYVFFREHVTEMSKNLRHKKSFFMAHMNHIFAGNYSIDFARINLHGQRFLFLIKRKFGKSEINRGKKCFTRSSRKEVGGLPLPPRFVSCLTEGHSFRLGFAWMGHF